MIVVIRTRRMLVGLVLISRKPRWVAVGTNRATQTLDEDAEDDHDHAHVPQL